MNNKPYSMYLCCGSVMQNLDGKCLEISTHPDLMEIDCGGFG